MQIPYMVNSNEDALKFLEIGPQQSNFDSYFNKKFYMLVQH